MDLKSEPVSVLEGDGLSMSRILDRESSVGQSSSRIFYRSAQGIPFKWEMQPGTPIHPQQEDEIPPVCPSPLMQSMGLPLPNLDHEEDPHQESKIAKIWSLRKMVKKRIITSDLSKKLEMLIGRSGNKQEESSSRFGDSSFCSNSWSDSSLSSLSRRDRVADVDGGPFCCSPWNVPAILEEGKTRIYYCSKHKTAFAVEEDGTFLATILSRSDNNSHDQFSGPLQNEAITPAAIPFTWETQPGTPKRPPENDVIPPPSPPPATHSLGLPLPRLSDDEERPESKWNKARFWRRRKDVEKKNKGIDGGMEHEMSFRKTEKETGSSFLGKGGWRVSRNRRSLKGDCSSCGPWSRRDILVFARRKFKSFLS